ncbi:MAG: hypothetical protein Q4C04_04515 [Clostridia bacterium]|nr:hypothetical protein [Clostridia bacterium]
MTRLEPPFKGYVDLAVAEVREGLCRDVTLYVVGEGRAPRHYYCQDGCIDITDPICDYIDDSGIAYEDLITAICETISAHGRPREDIYTGEYIPLHQYAQIHGRALRSVQQKAQRGGFVSAKRVGKLWIIKEDEPYSDLRRVDFNSAEESKNGET